MCGRYNLITDAIALVDFFDIEQTLFDISGFGPHYNIAPGQDVPLVRDGSNGRALVLARWGLVPHWSKESKTKYSTINARAETVAEKPTYRDSFKRRRCLPRGSTSGNGTVNKKSLSIYSLQRVVCLHLPDSGTAGKSREKLSTVAQSL